MQAEYGKWLLKRRDELVERSFAHCYETEGMRRCHLRGRENILKRQLAHVSAFNLGLVMRQLLGAGTPRELKNRVAPVILQILRLLTGQNRPASTAEPQTSRFSFHPEPIVMLTRSGPKSSVFIVIGLWPRSTSGL